MISHTNLKKGVRIILDKEPYEVLESNLMKKAQRRVIIQTKIKNLITGNVLSRNFHQGDVFEEAEISKFAAKFIYCHRDKFIFSKDGDHSKRFHFNKEHILSIIGFLKPNQKVEALEFDGIIINISLPIKIQLKVIEAPPGVKGERSQSGNKVVSLETGTKINVPLFIKEGDIIEINTERAEYVRRI
jgi:elongation factor P|tara:strand:+ start:3780 stop:4340 length:561 start_codon:yes stop_codon:yes gene_type:complete